MSRRRERGQPLARHTRPGFARQRPDAPRTSGREAPQPYVADGEARQVVALVTGAAGFIGSHLSERLLASGHRVIGVDCFCDDYARDLKTMNLEVAAKHPDFELVELDLADGSLSELFDGVDVVFHLAARSGVRDCSRDFDAHSEANLSGSRAVFDAAARTGTRVVYASASSVYGDARQLPMSEEHTPHPVSPRGASKLMTETLATEYASSCGLMATGLRYFTVYGPRQRPDMCLARFIEALVEGQLLPLYGDGLQQRDMTFVGDVVAATIAAAYRGAPGALYNIGSGTRRPLLEVLGELGDIIGAPLRLAHEPARTGDVRCTWADISRATADLGYVPSTPLAEGLASQVAEAARRRQSLTLVQSS